MLTSSNVGITTTKRTAAAAAKEKDYMIAVAPTSNDHVTSSFADIAVAKRRRCTYHKPDKMESKPVIITSSPEYNNYGVPSSTAAAIIGKNNKQSSCRYKNDDDDGKPRNERTTKPVVTADSVSSSTGISAKSMTTTIVSSTTTTVNTIKSEVIFCNDRDGFFDYDQEYHKLPDYHFSVNREAKDNIQRFQNYDELIDACKSMKCTYNDVETFYAALELYNRESVVPKETTTGEFLVPNETTTGSSFKYAPPINYTKLFVRDSWTRKEVRGYRMNPCGQCDEKFPPPHSNPPPYYITGRSMHACEGCMGRNLYYRYGCDKEEILKKLDKLRKEQEIPQNLQKMMLFQSEYCDVSHYKDVYEGKWTRCYGVVARIECVFPANPAKLLIQHYMDGNNVTQKNCEEAKAGMPLTIDNEEKKKDYSAMGVTLSIKPILNKQRWQFENIGPWWEARRHLLP